MIRSSEVAWWDTLKINVSQQVDARKYSLIWLSGIAAAAFFIYVIISFVLYIFIILIMSIGKPQW